MTGLVIERCLTPQETGRLHPVMAQLRPHLSGAAMGAEIAKVQAGGGHLIGAFDGDACLGCATYRFQTRLSFGRMVYVDDLVTNEDARSRGVGAALLDWIEVEARANGATQCVLDSGTQRVRAHRFYFRQGYAITAFNFKKPLGPPPG